MRRSISSRDGIRDAWQVWNVVVSPSLNCSVPVRPTLAVTPAIAASHTTIPSALPIAPIAKLAADVPEKLTQNLSVSTEEVNLSGFTENEQKIKQIDIHIYVCTTDIRHYLRNKQTIYLFLT